MVTFNDKNRPDNWWSKEGGNLHWLEVYQPISGMSVNGKHAGWVGLQFNETGKGSREQVTWRSILFNNVLKIYEWQSICTSYSKTHNKKQVYLNGVKYLDYVVDENPENIFISKDFFSHVYITFSFRGYFTDLQVFSTPMKEEDLLGWTTCQYHQPGDVFQWDMKKLNLTHDERIISEFGKVDSKAFCQNKGSSKREVHRFGDSRFNPMSNIEANIVCKRLNGKIRNFPTTKEGINQVVDSLTSFAEKSNQTWADGWMGGVAKPGEESKAFIP